MSKPMKKANELPQFTGPFQELIPKYISYKRAQGYKIGSFVGRTPFRGK